MASRVGSWIPRVRAKHSASRRRSTSPLGCGAPSSGIGSIEYRTRRDYRDWGSCRRSRPLHAVPGRALGGGCGRTGAAAHRRVVSGASSTGRAVITETGGAAADHARYTQSRVAHWEAVAAGQGRADAGRYYRRRLRQVFTAHVPSGQRVLEIGCATGELLAAIAPVHGVGIDFSPLMVNEARRRHPQLTFAVADAHDLAGIEGTFDVVILSDLMNDLWDVQRVLEQVATVCHSGTRVVVNNYSRLWEVPLSIASGLGIARPRLQQNWLTTEDVANLFHLAGFEVVRQWPELLWPIPTPVSAS